MPGLSAIAMCRLLAEGEYSVLIAVEDSDTARNIVVVCSGSHEKKVNLGEVFRAGLVVCR